MRYDAILIDFRNAFHRAYHVAGELSTEIDGVQTPVGAVYQVTRMCISLYDEFAGPGAAFIVCDEGAPTKRQEIWDGYKAKRTPHSQDITSQLVLSHDLFTRLGWSRATSEGWEADDVIATIAASLEETGKMVAIVTGDHDLHQCITERVHVVDPNSKRHELIDGRTWRVRDVTKRWGVEPARIPEVKALAGDSSDGYPGVPSIGEKYAVAIMRAYPDIDAVITRALEHKTFEVELDGEFRDIRRCSAVRDVVEMVPVYLDLANVRRDVPLEFAPRTRNPDPITEFRRLRFASLTAPSTVATCFAMAGKVSVPTTTGPGSRRAVRPRR